MVNINNFISEVFSYFKSDLNDNIEDPKSGSRTNSSKFVMTSSPKRNVIYPLVTLKMPTFDASRAGMQTTSMDLTIQIEARVWARNEKDKDQIANQIYDRLRTTQFIVEGTIDQELHDFALLSATEVDDDGELGVKSRILVFQYKLFNVN